MTSMKMKCTNFVTQECVTSSVLTTNPQAATATNYAEIIYNLTVPVPTTPPPAMIGTQVNAGVAGSYLTPHDPGSLNGVSITGGTLITLTEGGNWYLSVDVPTTDDAFGNHSLALLVSINGVTPPTKFCGGATFFTGGIASSLTGSCVLPNLAPGSTLEFYYELTGGGVLPSLISTPTPGTVTLFKLRN